MQQRLPGHPSVGDSPVRLDFPTGQVGHEEYMLAWHIWRAQNRDCSPTLAEVNVKHDAVEELLRQEYGR